MRSKPLPTRSCLSASRPCSRSALGLATLAVARGRARSTVDGSITLTFALPGSTLAVGVLLAFGPLARNTLLIILLAYVAKFWVLGYRPLAGVFRSLAVDISRAARASGADAWTTARTITLAPAAAGDPGLRPARLPLRPARADDVEPALRSADGDPCGRRAQPAAARRPRPDDCPGGHHHAWSSVPSGCPSRPPAPRSPAVGGTHERRPAASRRLPLRQRRLRSGRQVVDEVSLDVSRRARWSPCSAHPAPARRRLLNAIAGFLPIASGRIEIGGREVATPQAAEPPERRSVGMVFQHYGLWPHLSALETVAYPLRRAGLAAAAARSEASRYLDQMRISRPSAAAAGRAVGRRAAASGRGTRPGAQAAVFLLDEPTAHLDTALRTELQDELAERRRADGAAALMATHDIEEALGLADRVVLLREGRVIQTGTPTEVYERPIDAWAARMTGPVSVVDGSRMCSPGLGLIRRPHRRDRRGRSIRGHPYRLSAGHRDRKTPAARRWPAAPCSRRRRHLPHQSRLAA